MSSLCLMSGEKSPGENEFPYWGVTNAQIDKIICPECFALVSLNNKTRLIRKHKVT